MIICIENYKSIQKLKLELGRVTVLIGENGCGKSNILEAIALSAAAASGKLDNEFWVSRGIRETEPELMRSAFDKDNLDKAIKISIGEDKETYFDYTLQNNNKAYTKWINETASLDNTILTINKGLASIGDSFEKNLSQGFDESFYEAHKQYLLSMNEIAVSLKNKNDYLGEFIIYSPEYQCLRKFREEGQIRPLGINGEGLFKLLQVLSSDKDKIYEIKERLKLIGWFKDFKIPDNLFIGERAIQIEDRYLDSELTFDQRSTNEGFLFLLFYFCLFISSDTPKFFAIDNIDASFNPKLCRRLIKELVDLAKKYDKQVVFTTHNPAILDGLNLDDDEQRLFIVSRNRSGYTKLKRFLKPETPEGEKPIRMSEAFLRGYLGGLPKSF